VLSYVDDFLICYRSKHIHIIERHLQRCLNKLQYWADTNGFRFSTSKTVCIHFCGLLKPHLDPHLSLNGMPSPVVEKTKFPGLTFDCKLSFIPHLHFLKEKCLKAINLLRVVARTSWGPDLVWDCVQSLWKIAIFPQPEVGHCMAFRYRRYCRPIAATAGICVIQKACCIHVRLQVQIE